jgi:hypothetical protein
MGNEGLKVCNKRQWMEKNEYLRRPRLSEGCTAKE